MAVSRFPPPPESLRQDPAVLQWLVQLVNRTLRNNLAATETVAGNVLRGAAVADAPTSGVAVTAPDTAVSDVAVTAAAAPAQGAGYVQADVNAVVALVNEIRGDVNQLVADVNATAVLANALKAELNQLVADVNGIAAQLNALLESQRAAGQISAGQIGP